uniref:PAP-associated domain-containing protein n=1 Tax=Rhabditophanes sp. KR3021 TaxID=114890 RepID=A0AC35UFY2_9BILA
MKRTSQYMPDEHVTKKYRSDVIVIDGSSDEGGSSPTILANETVLIDKAGDEQKLEGSQHNESVYLLKFDKALPGNGSQINGKIIVIGEEDLAGDYNELESSPLPSQQVKNEEGRVSSMDKDAIPDIVVINSDSPILAPENSPASSDGELSSETLLIVDQVQNEFGNIPVLTEGSESLYRFDLQHAKDEDRNSGGVDHSKFAQKRAADLHTKLRTLGSVNYLTFEIERHFYNNRQDHETLSKKDQLSKRIEALLQRIYPRSKLFMTGSSVTKLGSYNCDIDMCWYVASLRETSPHHCPTKQVIQGCLEKARKALRQSFGSAIKEAIVIKAVVPILKFRIIFESTEFEIDININNTPGILNSKLLHYYSLYDIRFQQLVLVLKHWAIINKIKDAQFGYFNSYSIALLVLHYLQAGVHPYILPNLHKLYPKIFKDQMALMCLEYDKKFEPPRTSQHPDVNRQPVGELLIGFFHYYNAFDFNNLAISIRCGGTMKRYGCIHDDPMQYRLFIEEPFDHKNTARCLTEKDNWEHVKRLFRDALDKLLASRGDKHGLSSIGIRL